MKVAATASAVVVAVSAGLTHKQTKQALRAPSCQRAPSKTGRKLINFTFQSVQI